MNEQEEQSAEEQTPSPGQQLQRARKAAGLTVKDIADKLRLKPSHIEELEADKVDESISLTFTKGYLKNYAKQVGLDVNELLAAFDTYHKTSKEPAKLQSFSRRVAKQANDDRLMLVTYLVVVVVIALVVLWWWQQGSGGSVFTATDSQEVPVAEQDAEQPSATATQPEVVARKPEETASTTLAEQNSVDAAMVEETSVTLGSANDGDVGEASADAGSPAEGQAVPVAATPGAQTPEADDEMQPEGPPQSDVAEQALAPVADEAVEPRPVFDTTGLEQIELVFQFAGDCWINITDATGEAIAYGVKAQGRVMPISGYPPFEVVLGAPEVVQISYNGDVVDMSQFPSGRTARFELPLAE